MQCMKKRIVDKLIQFVTTSKKLDDIKIEELRYGLSSIYSTYSKLIVITLIALVLNIFKEYLLFLIFYNIIRTFSFGLHATKSWICWISSTIIFLGMPILSSHLMIPIVVKILLGSLLIIQFYMNAPADTYKRPIISKNRRLFFKYASTLITFIYMLVCVVTKNNLLSNILFLSTLVQAIIISPYTYKLFNLPFNNYKNYITE